MIREPIADDDSLSLRHTHSHIYVMTIMAPLSPPTRNKNRSGNLSRSILSADMPGRELIMKMKGWMDMDGSYEFFLLSLIFILAQDFCTLSTPRLALWPPPLSEVVVGVASSCSAVVNLSETVGHFQNGGSGLLLIPFYSIIYARGYGGRRNTR